MIKQAHEAYNSKDFSSGTLNNAQLSNEDNADAMTSLGYMYQNAQGCEKDEAKALQLYERAAELKQPYALYNLGVLYTERAGGGNTLTSLRLMISL